MSDDLISRSALLKALEEKVCPEKYGEKCNPLDVINGVLQVIAEQPTAYDVDKVVERLEQEGNGIFSTHFPEDEQEFMDNGIAKGFWRSAEIVKSGGIE